MGRIGAFSDSGGTDIRCVADVVRAIDDDNVVSRASCSCCRAAANAAHPQVFFIGAQSEYARDFKPPSSQPVSFAAAAA